jgi:hypothetical protein
MPSECAQSAHLSALHEAPQSTTGPTPLPLVAIGRHGANSNDCAFPTPNNKCWPGLMISPSTLSPLASSPSKSNGIAAPAAGTDDHWPIHATASPMYCTQISTTVTSSMSPTSVFREQSAPKVKMEPAPNSQVGLVHGEACSIVNTVMDTEAIQATLSVKDTIVSAGNATLDTTLGFPAPPSTQAPSATSAVLALPVFATRPPTGTDNRTVTTAPPIFDT